MSLKWQRGADGALYGFSGGVNRAQISACAGPKHFRWAIFGASADGIKTHGYCKTERHAQRAVDRAWSRAVAMGALAA